MVEKAERGRQQDWPVNLSVYCPNSPGSPFRLYLLKMPQPLTNVRAWLPEGDGTEKVLDFLQLELQEHRTDKTLKRIK